LTEGFVGSIWLGYDRPLPMPGIHGGGTPAKAFAKLTDFYYLRLAQARFAGRDEEPGGAAWGRLKTFAARQPGIIAMTTLGSLVMLCFLLPALFRRRELPASAPSLEPPDDDRDLPHQPYQQPPQQSA
jgi:hypothetical protein